MPDDPTPGMGFPSFPVHPTTCDYAAIDGADCLDDAKPDTVISEPCPECNRPVPYSPDSVVHRCACGCELETWNGVVQVRKPDGPFTVGS